MTATPPEGAIPLSPRQRDYLATYPDEVLVWVVEHDAERGVRIWANSEYAREHREFWLPFEGFLDQPTITVEENTHDLDIWPETDHPHEGS